MNPTVEPWFSALYDAVTAQLEHEVDALGYEGNAEGVESLERIKAAVADVNAKRHEAEEDPVERCIKVANPAISKQWLRREISRGREL